MLTLKNAYFTERCREWTVLQSPWDSKQQGRELSPVLSQIKHGVLRVDYPGNTWPWGLPRGTEHVWGVWAPEVVVEVAQAGTEPGCPI
jgi:hypothetical protein